MGDFQELSDFAYVEANKNEFKSILKSFLSSRKGDFEGTVLDEGSVTNLVNIFTNNYLNVEIGLMVLEALISYRRLPEEHVKKLLMWSFFNFKRSTELTAILYSWLAVLAENELVARLPFFKCYSCLHKTMQEKELLPSLCSLLIVTAHPKLVTARIADLTLRWYEKFDKSKHIAALLQIYKQFHPNIVQVKLPKTDGWPKVNMKPSLEDTFNKLKFKKLSSSCESCEHRGLKARIPEPYYDKEPGNPPYRFTSFYSIKEIEDLNEVALPLNTASLLQNSVGMFFLARRPLEELTNFSVVIGSELQEPNVNLLDAVVEFQECTQEAVPSVYNSFLPKYLVTWNGRYFRQQILSLIHWIPVTSYPDLSQNFIFAIARQYITADLKLKVEILQALSQMISNIVATQMARAKNNVPSLFGTPVPNWIENEPEITLSNIRRCMDNFIQNGLMVHNMSTFSLLHQALLYYNMMSRLEIAHNLDSWTVVPKYVLYSCLFSRNCNLINHICALLVRYKKVVIPYLQERDLFFNFKAEIKSINMFTSDLLGFLIKDREWTDMLPNLLHNLSPQEVELLEGQFNTKTVLNIESHIALAPFIEMVSTNAGFDPTMLKTENLMMLLQTFLEGIYEFITLGDD